MMQLEEFVSSATAGGDPLATAFLATVLFLSGSVAASFFTLCAMRAGDAPRGLLRAISLPASHCDHCKHPLRPLHLVPVFGWIASRGRCRECGKSVSAVYPVTEFLLGLATALLPWIAPGGIVPLLLLILLLWLSFLAAAIDAVEHVIPEEMTWVLLFAGLLASPFGYDIADRVSSAALCALAMYAALGLVGYMKSVDTRAGGDVAIAAALGGWFGLAAAPAFLLITSIAYICYALPLRMKQVLWVPMGPAFAASAFALVLLQHAEIHLIL